MADYEDGLIIARAVARERDERFAQLRASEVEADRYRKALRQIADAPIHAWLHPISYYLQSIARKALGDYESTKPPTNGGLA